MATINASTSEKVVSVKKWLGLNQCADGDTMLNVGEASVMKNFKVTRDGTLKRRPGMTRVMALGYAYEVDIAESTSRTKTTSSSEKVELFSGYTVSQSTGVITLTSSVGDCTASEARTLLENAGSGQYYYYYFASNYYRLSSIANTSGRTGGGYAWMGYKLIVSSTSAGTHDPAWIWSGYVGGKEQVVAVCEQYLYALWNPTADDWYSDKLKVGYVGEQGVTNPPNSVCFFPFDNKLYILTDKEYYVWDGTHPNPYTGKVSKVTGYYPLIATSLQPDTGGAPGSYELLEAVNRLNGVRRVWLSPDGTGTTFHMPEKCNIDSVTDLTTNPPTELNGEYYTDGSFADGVDYLWKDDGTIIFKTAPAESVNSYEVQYLAYSYSASPDSDYQKYRRQVVNKTGYELYSGKTDTVIFLYGDGTNKAIYSGMDYYGQPRADYFPDLNDIAIGDENTPITQMIRHNAALLAFKKDSAWAIQQDIITLADGSQTFGYYVTPVNKAVGNEALGQVQLVDNDPITLFNKNIYRWVNSSYYSSNLTRDERQARVISDRVHTICDELDFENVMMWDDNDHQELYISNKLNKSLVWNYGKDAWYEYDIGPYAFINFHGTLYFCAGAGFLYEFDEDAESDDGEPINAQWVSGAMDFGVDYSRKYSSMLWVGLKAEEGTSVDVTVRTDRKDTFKEKVVPSTKAKVVGEPFMVKTKIKAKKFIYYRLILESNEIAPPVTVTTADIRVRMTGYAK